MSVPKTSVSTLQEFCSKKKIPFPVYTTITDDEHGFICKIELMDFEEMGNGRSKRDAKHLAAQAVLKRLKNSGQFDLKSVDDAAALNDSDMVLPPVDMVMVLRDYCVQLEHPLPKFELVNQCGTPNAPRFTMLCQIASIIRYGTSDTKKDAKQRAAFEMFQAIKDRSNTIDRQLEIVSFQSKVEAEKEERYQLFKTYRELVESGEKTENFGIKLNERHDFFTRFHSELKNAAFAIINTEYESEKTKAFEVLEALKLKTKIDKFPSTSGKEMIFIELDCKGLDVCFAGFENEIYSYIIKYFKNMLV